MITLPPHIIERIRQPVPCGDGHPAAYRQPCQLGWYAEIARQCGGGTLLDVGAGLGAGVAYLRYLGVEAYGCDVDPQLAGLPHLTVADDLSAFGDRSFDHVACVDVIEHVTDPTALLTDLRRIARRKVFVSSPNYARAGMANPAHACEFTIREALDLFGPRELHVGSPDGWHEVRLLFSAARPGWLSAATGQLYAAAADIPDHELLYAGDGLEWPHWLAVLNP